MKLKYLISFLFAFVAFGSASAQNLAIKTNLLYDATATVNLGLEIGLGKRTTLDISGNYNAWYTNEAANEKIRHMLVQPEFRYYFCEKMSGHFLGVHALFTEYNICGENWLLDAVGSVSSLRGEGIPDSRYEGVGYGAGLAYGYDIVLSNRLNLELSVGAGYVHLDYDRYGANKCAPLLDSAQKDYWGITKLGVSLVYIIK